MNKIGSPSAERLTWAVQRLRGGCVLGYVSERMWFDARKEACAKFGVSPDEIELESMGPTLAWQRNRFEATKRGKESVRKVRANRRKAKK